MTNILQNDFNHFKICSFLDERGSLSVIEFEKISISPRRIFWVNNVPIGLERAAHFHRKCNQILICTEGRVNIKVTDSKLQDRGFVLEKNHAFLLQVNNLVEYSFQTPETQLLVLADQAYDPTDVFTIHEWNETSE